MGDRRRAGTVHDNLPLANPHATFEDIVHACRPVGIHGAIEHFCRTLNHLRGQVTMLFITHQLPKALQVDGMIRIGGAPAGTAPAGAAPAGAPAGAVPPASAVQGRTP